MTIAQVNNMTREDHIKRLERSMQRWRDDGMDCDGIFDDDYKMYMKKLDALKSGASFKIVDVPNELAIGIAHCGSEISNLQRVEAGAKYKELSHHQLQECVNLINQTQ